MDRQIYSRIENYMRDCMGDSAHDCEHVRRVLYAALDIAAHEPAPVDFAVLTAACLLPFLLLVKYHNRLFLRKDYQEKRLEVNRQELAALDQDSSAFDDGKEFADPAHPYTYDLDVFGPRSLFQYVNRTCTRLGREQLARWMACHLDKQEPILRRQEAEQELAATPSFTLQPDSASISASWAC